MGDVQFRPVHAGWDSGDPVEPVVRTGGRGVLDDASAWSPGDVTGTRRRESPDDQRRKRLTLSTTQAGRSLSSTSTVTRITAW